MRLTAKATVEIARSPEQVFDVATDPGGLPGIMKKVAPIPGVSSVEMEGDGQLRAGARRKVRMSDGSVMGEAISVLDRPRAYRYNWLNPPAIPFNLMVRTAEADWRFSPSGGGTRIDWVYTFELTTPLVWPLAWPVIQRFSTWMSRALGEIKILAEGAPR